MGTRRAYVLGRERGEWVREAPADEVRCNWILRDRAFDRRRREM